MKTDNGIRGPPKKDGAERKVSEARSRKGGEIVATRFCSFPGSLFPPAPGQHGNYVSRLNLVSEPTLSFTLSTAINAFYYRQAAGEQRYTYLERMLRGISIFSSVREEQLRTRRCLFAERRSAIRRSTDAGMFHCNSTRAILIGSVRVSRSPSKLFLPGIDRSRVGRGTLASTSSVRTRN